MAPFNGLTLAHINTQRGAVDVLFEIMDSDGVPPQEGLHIAFPNQTRQMLATARMDNHWACNNDGFTTPLFNPAQFPGDLLHLDFDAALARYTRAHEGEFLRSRLGGLVKGQNTFIATDHPLTDLEIAHQTATRGERIALSLNHNHTVHALRLH